MWQETRDAGWVGNWSPGIGDPSVMGWLTVVLYLAVAWQCLALARRKVLSLQTNERQVWLGIGGLLLALGVNKQLDLQSAFTELGRRMAHQQGWYEQRGEVQQFFVMSIGVLGAACVVGMALVVRRMPGAVRLALVGLILLGAFVLMRASSFHHMDSFIQLEWAGLRANWVLEMGGITVVGWAAHLRNRPTHLRNRPTQRRKPNTHRVGS